MWKWQVLFDFDGAQVEAEEEEADAHECIHLDTAIVRAARARVTIAMRSMAFAGVCVCVCAMRPLVKWFFKEPSAHQHTSAVYTKLEFRMQRYVNERKIHLWLVSVCVAAAVAAVS